MATEGLGADMMSALSALEKQGAAGVEALWKAVLDNLGAHHAETIAAAGAPPDPGDGVTRTPKGVLVSSKDMVMRTFLNADENYSVIGYHERSSQSIGPIYLGLDWGPEYAAQATKANASIHAVTRKEGFERALEATRAALTPLPDRSAFDIQEVTDAVLASVCSYWFDLPDMVHVFPGGWRLSNILPPARCPSDYAPPSGYIFHPDPGVLLTLLGQHLGQMLRKAVGEYVAAHRAPGNPPGGVLTRAFFAEFPDSPAQDDLLARVIIGAMMGMLPTVNGNLVGSVKAWQASGEFNTIKASFKASAVADPFDRARAVLEIPLMHAMQRAPTPDAVWRTAVKDHTLGTKCPVEVKKGDKVYVSIASATREDLANGKADVCPVFGGDRSATPHPLHACPGMEMAMGVLLGVIYGLME